MGKVIEMPDQLERRAQKIEAALDRQIDAMDRSSTADKDWKNATFELAVELAAAKKELRTNQAFGKWCSERFGENRLPHQDRAVLVRWGEDPEGTRTMLVNQSSRSVRIIDSRLTSTGKTQRQPSPKRDQVKAFIHAYAAEHGANPPYALVEEETGVSNNVVIRAFGEVKLETEPKLTKGQNYDVEARLKVRMRELEREFEARVIAKNQEEIAKLFPMLEELQNSAKLNEKYYGDLIAKNAILTEAECLDIIKACHPDNSATTEVRRRAFVAINSKKRQLTGKP